MECKSQLIFYETERERERERERESNTHIWESSVRERLGNEGQDDGEGDG